MGENSPQRSRAEYIRRVNRAIDHMDAHLGREVPLAELAAVACFSRYHFHRVFKVVTGETVGQYRLRLRLQRAASFLAYNADRSVTWIAYECGFAEASAFSRAFRKAYGECPSFWRENNRVQEDRNPGQAASNPCQSSAELTRYPAWAQKQPTWLLKMKDMQEISVTIENMDDLLVASVRHTGSYSEIGPAFDTLYAWASPRGFVNPSAKILGIYHDMPGVTPEDKLRSDACVTVPEGTKGEGPIVVKKLSTKGRYAFGHFEFDGKEGFQKAWNAMMGVWLPKSGYQCDDRPTFELYRNDCSTNHYVVDICIPVRPQ